MYSNFNESESDNRNNRNNNNGNGNNNCNNSYIDQFNTSNILTPNPTFTKQTRCNNNFNINCYRDDFFRPRLSNIGSPISTNHDNYMIDMNAQSFYDIERSGMCTRNNNNNLIDKNTPVQNAFQNNYHTMQFDNRTNDNNEEVNKYLTRNPVNTKRDDLEKIRNQEHQNFIKVQGGPLTNFGDFKVENTRKGRNDINSSNYIPMPRTMAIPKENI